MAKAEGAEQKALSAKDAAAAEQAWREAGRLWERAADREPDAKRRVAYAANADRARAHADGNEAGNEAGNDAEPADEGSGSAPTN